MGLNRMIEEAKDSSENYLRNPSFGKILSESSFKLESELTSTKDLRFQKLMSIPRHTIGGYSNITHGKSAKIIERKRLFSSDPKPKAIIKYNPPPARESKVRKMSKRDYEASEKMRRVFVKSELPDYHKLPDKHQVIDQIIEKSIDQDEKEPSNYTDSLNYFKNSFRRQTSEMTLGEGKSSSRSRAGLKFSKSELNDISKSFLRKSYFSPQERLRDKSIRINTDFKKPTKDLKPTSKLFQNTDYIKKWMSDQIEQVEDAGQHEKVEHLLRSYNRAFEEITDKFVARKNKTNAAALKRVWDNTLQTLIIQMNEAIKERNMKLELLERYLKEE